MHLLEATEKDKTMEGLSRLCDTLIEERISKDSIIIGFGGGVTGNMVGLAAALIYRGIRYIEVPTTFMGMTDSSLSNKQAVNGGNGKNQLGVFKAPLFVWCDMCYAETESLRHIKAAYAEGIKNVLINDTDNLNYFFDQKFLREYQDKFQLFNSFEIITDAKNEILGIDPTEKKYAVVLEYGHTFGHAIEYLTNGEVIHGEAVAMGMCIAAEISYRMNGISSEELELHYELLKDFFYKSTDYKLLDVISIEDIVYEIKNDNKRTASGIKYVLLNKIGECMNPDGDWQVKVDNSLVEECLDLFFLKYNSYNRRGEEENDQSCI